MSRYSQKPTVSGVTRFTHAPDSVVEFSRMRVAPSRYLTFNAGEIVPVYHKEILPHETIDMSVDFIVRQTTSLRPVMGELDLDIYAFWVPNRIINESWVNVQGENTSSYWTAPEVELAPLVDLDKTKLSTAVKFNPESVADYYGLPTQDLIPLRTLAQMNDLKFRGYLEIYNRYFRDQNYQAPIPYSKLNIYEGFLESSGTTLYTTVPGEQTSDGSYEAGAIVKGLSGDGSTSTQLDHTFYYLTNFNINSRPLKANKLHDAFTSVLPTPQKGSDVIFGVGDNVPVTLDTTDGYTSLFPSGNRLTLRMDTAGTNLSIGSMTPLYGQGYAYNGTMLIGGLRGSETTSSSGTPNHIVGSNLIAEADLSEATGISINDLRTAIATQQVYEQLARGGSRYVEMIRAFFDIETETPFTDIPIQLGHVRNVLDMYQVAQTSSSVEGETPQGNLTAFGYTDKGGHLFNRTFLEHGYLHVFAVVRQKNLYSTYLAPDNFRRSMLDFYTPQLANISEQPILLRTLNPFVTGNDSLVLGYQEAWWEYRYEMDTASGYFRSGLSESLVGWTYADNYDIDFSHVNGEWLKSNAQEVIDNTLAVTSSIASQFFGVFTFKIDKQLPMPIYSVPGLDMI